MLDVTRPNGHVYCRGSHVSNDKRLLARRCNLLCSETSNTIADAVPCGAARCNDVPHINKQSIDQAYPQSLREPMFTGASNPRRCTPFRDQAARARGNLETTVNLNVNRVSEL